MKNKWWIVLLLLLGCNTHKERSKPLPDLPDHFLLPTSPPQYNVQINPVPFPFNITGSYVVWVNNEKINLNKSQVNALAKHLNLPLSNPKDTAQIHNGLGWLEPFKTK